LTIKSSREHYTADKVGIVLQRVLLLYAHHLVLYSCSIISWVMSLEVQMCGSSSFTNDCIGFLMGGSILAWIKGAFFSRPCPLPFLNRYLNNQICPLTFFRCLSAHYPANSTLTDHGPFLLHLSPVSHLRSCHRPNCQCVSRATSSPSHSTTALGSNPTTTTTIHPSTNPHHSATCWARTAPSQLCSRPRCAHHEDDRARIWGVRAGKGRALGHIC
jgi:hypothetical protein